MLAFVENEGLVIYLGIVQVPLLCYVLVDPTIHVKWMFARILGFRI
jgi:hypothetical protein